jgi:nickel-type superoxide dismutase maturation protease
VTLPPARVSLAVFVIIIGLAGWVATSLRRFRVFDTSMQPTLRPGDRILALTWAPPRADAVIVFRDPERGATFTVKRVQALTARGEVIVRGDNPNVSRDSRHFGPVPRSLVVGRALYRYLPGPRRGRI